MRLTTILLSVFLGFFPLAAFSACGGSFQEFVNALKREAVAKGHDATTVDRFFASIRQSKSVLRADRSQGHFQKPFLDFSANLISDARLKKGQRLGREYDAVFDRIEREYGISRGVIIAFWAFETAYGGRPPAWAGWPNWWSTGCRGLWSLRAMWRSWQRPSPVWRRIPRGAGPWGRRVVPARWAERVYSQYSHLLHWISKAGG